MGTTVVVLCENKLIGTDAILPVLIEIQSRYPSTRFLFVFPSEAQLRLIQRNYHLWEGINLLRPSIFTLQPGRRIASIIVLLRLARQLVFRRICIMKDFDRLPYQRMFIRLLRVVTSIMEVKTYLPALSLEAFENIDVQHALYAKRRGRSVDPTYFQDEHDVFISTLSAEEFRRYFRAGTPPKPFVKIGYPRRLPAWQRFMERAVMGHPMLRRTPYYLYILTTLDRVSRFLDEPPIGELLEETLSVLSRYSGAVHTIFRPHATTDLTALRRILDRVGYVNYTIDFGHPMILSSHARFLIGNSFSTTMFDAYCLGKPIVEYCSYDRELLQRMGGSYGGRCCDFFIDRDPSQLEHVVDALIHAPRSMHRDPRFIAENFSEVTPAFDQFLTTVVGNAPQCRPLR